MSGRKPTFLLGRLECTKYRHWPGSLRVNLEKIREAAERVARSEGLEVVDVEWKVGKERFLRVSIDRLPTAEPTGASGEGTASEADPSAEPAGGKYDGVGHLDCEKVSRQLSVIIDVEELIPGAQGYVLEVSSPGLDRELKKAADFERFAGRLAKISTAEPVGEAKFFEGRLAGLVDGKVRMALNGKEARVVELPLEVIRKANLVVEW
jgi:ribosome maturation factor RimP